MAFELIIDPEAAQEIVKEGAIIRLQTVIGIDIDIDAFYTVTVALDYGLPTHGAELSFWIDEEFDNGVQYTCWDGAETHFIHGPDRNAVLECVLTFTNALIGRVRPECVSMTAISDHLPPRALNKYLKIKDIFLAKGSDVQEKNDNEHFSWLFFLGSATFLA